MALVSKGLLEFLILGQFEILAEYFKRFCTIIIHDSRAVHEDVKIIFFCTNSYEIMLQLFQKFHHVKKTYIQSDSNSRVNYIGTLKKTFLIKDYTSD